MASVYRAAKQQGAEVTAQNQEIHTVVQYKNAKIIGNFNIPSVDWDLMNEDQRGNRLIETVEDAA